ncbi:MAG: ECF transporter S component [Bacillota bacterium]
MNSRKIVISGLLGAIAIILGATPLGFIPVPTPAGNATIMHIPAIIGAIVEGPLVGAFIGLVFGVYSFTRGGAFFSDPVIAILPRLFIGIVAYLVFVPFKSKSFFGPALAAVAGTLTNTVGVLSLAVLRGYLPSWEAAGAIAFLHGIPEIIVAVIIVVLVARVLHVPGKKPVLAKNGVGKE